MKKRIKLLFASLLVVTVVAVSPVGEIKANAGCYNIMPPWGPMIIQCD